MERSRRRKEEEVGKKDKVEGIKGMRGRSRRWKLEEKRENQEVGTIRRR